MLQRDITDSIDHVQKLEEVCREIIINTERMAQLKEKEILMLQNSFQNLQQDNEKLKYDLQNDCKESEDLRGTISAMK
jgi:hypothetical protein